MWKNKLMFNKDFYIEISFWVAIIFASLYFDKSFTQKSIVNNIIWIGAIVLLIFDSFTIGVPKKDIR